MIAKRPGQYIHSTLITVPTQKDGEVIILLSVDNYSRFCFKPTLTKELSQFEVENHIKILLKELKIKQPNVKPTIYFSYAKKYLEQLSLKFKTECTLEFNPIVADEIALSVAKTFLNKNLF